MCFRTETHRILGSHPTTWYYSHGSDQNPRSSGLAPTNHRHRCSIVLRIYRVLSVFHSELLQDRKTPTTTNKEGHGLGMGRRPKKSVRTPKNPNVSTPGTSSTQL